MKTLVMMTAALLALGSSPGLTGSTLHKEVVGSWCPVDDEGVMWLAAEKCEKPELMMTIKPSRYEGWEFACRLTAVKTWFDPTIIRNTKEWGVKVSRVTASCDGMDCGWKERLTFYQSKGTLHMEDRRRYRDTCPK